MSGAQVEHSKRRCRTALGPHTREHRLLAGLDWSALEAKVLVAARIIKPHCRALRRGVISDAIDGRSKELARDDRSHERRSRVADRGVIPTMAAKATSMPEERPRPEDDPSEEARDRTRPGISASRTGPGPSGGARIAPYPVHGAAAPCRRCRAIARVSATAARGQRWGRWNDGGEIRTRPGAQYPGPL
jgi:hypothetical protein